MKKDMSKISQQQTGRTIRLARLPGMRCGAIGQPLAFVVIASGEGEGRHDRRHVDEVAEGIVGQPAKHQSGSVQDDASRAEMIGERPKRLHRLAGREAFLQQHLIRRRAVQEAVGDIAGGVEFQLMNEGGLIVMMPARARFESTRFDRVSLTDSFLARRRIRSSFSVPNWREESIVGKVRIGYNDDVCAGYPISGTEHGHGHCQENCRTTKGRSRKRRYRIGRR